MEKLSDLWIVLRVYYKNYKRRHDNRNIEDIPKKLQSQT